MEDYSVRLLAQDKDPHQDAELNYEAYIMSGRQQRNSCFNWCKEGVKMRRASLLIGSFVLILTTSALTASVLLRFMPRSCQVPAIVDPTTTNPPTTTTDVTTPIPATNGTSTTTESTTRLPSTTLIPPSTTTVLPSTTTVTPSTTTWATTTPSPPEPTTTDTPDPSTESSTSAPHNGTTTRGSTTTPPPSPPTGLAPSAYANPLSTILCSIMIIIALQHNTRKYSIF